MNAIRSLLINVGRVQADAGEVARYARMFVWAIFSPKAGSIDVCETSTAMWAATTRPAVTLARGVGTDARRSFR